MEPMLSMRLDQQVQGELYGGKTLVGKLHSAAKCDAGQLDLSRGGHATLPHGNSCDLGQPITVECWVRFDEKTQMPVFVSCGHWNRAGWFLQWLGGGWRCHVGGVDCDGSQPTVGSWFHLVGTYGGRTARLFENGKLIGEKAGAVNTAPWPGELHIGQYAGQPGPEFQLHGRVTGVNIYHRPLGEKEIVQAAAARPE